MAYESGKKPDPKVALGSISMSQQFPTDEPDRPVPNIADLRGVGSSAALCRFENTKAISIGKVRNLNINLITPFPRKMKLADWLFPSQNGKLRATQVGAVVYATVAVLVTIWVWGVAGPWCASALALILVPPGVVLLAIVVPLPGSGSLSQWLRQWLGGTTWSLDLYDAFIRSLKRNAILAFALYFGGAAIGVVMCEVITGRGWWSGPVGAIAVFAAVALAVWLLFPYLDRRSRRLGYDRKESLPKQVKRLSMVHALSWTMLPPFTVANSKKPKKDKLGSYRLLAFVSTFNEASDGYVGGFVETFGDALGGPWGLSPRFPKYQGRTEPRKESDKTDERKLWSTERGFLPFLEFVERTENPLEHSYSAYPHLTAVDVRNSLQIDRELRSFEIEWDKLPPKGELAEGARFKQFKRRIRHALPSIPDRVNGLDAGMDQQSTLAGQGNTSSAETTILVSFIPFGPAQSGNSSSKVQTWLKERLGNRGIDFGQVGFPPENGAAASVNSIFNTVAGTHLARASVVAKTDAVDGVVGPGTGRAVHFEDHTLVDNETHQPDGAHLLLAAHIDGDAYSWLIRLYDEIGKQAIDDLATAMGHTTPPANDVVFADFVLTHSHEPSVRQVDHQECTVWDIRRSAAVHRAVSEAFLTDSTDPKSVRDAVLAVADANPYRG